MRYILALLATWFTTYFAVGSTLAIIDEVKAILYAEEGPAKKVLWKRPGGVVQEHIRDANIWLKAKTVVVVLDDQYSAAAMQILYLHVKGADVCTTDNVSLHFHQPYFKIFDLRIGDPNYKVEFVRYFGKENTEIIGDVTINDWSSVDPQVFGIPNCSN